MRHAIPTAYQGDVLLNPKSRARFTRAQQLLMAGLLLFAASTAHANIIYQVNRSIGAGSLTGHIETNGTLGALTTADFVDWSLTLVSPDINGGAPSTIVDGSNPFLLSSPDVLSATGTELRFDFSINAFFYALTSTGDFWCLAGGGNVGCFEPGEVIGYSDSNGEASAVVAHQGIVAFGTAAATAVPLPASWALITIALGALAAQRRRAV
jgi:hypothetical protein